MPGTGSTPSISITITTSRGHVRGQWRPASVTRAAAILLPGAAGSHAESSHLFDELAVRIQQTGASVFQMEHYIGDFDERLASLLSALAALRRQGIERMALIGWHSGGTAAIAAGSRCDAVTGVAALTPEAAAIDFVADVAPRRLLLMHGAADHVVPAALSRMLYARAADPKELVIYPGERRDFSMYREEALDKLSDWTRCLLRSPFKPCGAQRETTGGMGLLDAVAQVSDSTLTAPSLR
ncbi:MAG TPA: alpha/beta hydrolase [Ktedonobacterales bacterium]